MHTCSMHMLHAHTDVCTDAHVTHLSGQARYLKALSAFVVDP